MSAFETNNQIITIIRDISSLVHKQIRASADAISGLSVIHMLILSYIAINQKIKNSDIATFLHTTKSTASIHLKHMEHANLIKRIHDKNDKRVEWISLSTKGKVMVQKINERKNKEIHKVLNLMPDTEKKLILTNLARLKTVLEKHYETI